MKSRKNTDVKFNKNLYNNMNNTDDYNYQRCYNYNNYLSKQEFRERGVTIMSLVITIIVLLILAGITIKLALDDNGIIKQSRLASEEYQNKALQEQFALNQISKEIENASNNVGSGNQSSSGGSTSGGTTSGSSENVDKLKKQIDELQAQVSALEANQATGNATASQVLAGATFSTSEGVGLTGIMVNRKIKPDDVAGMSSSYASLPTWNGTWLQYTQATDGTNRISICPPEGYYPGNGQAYVGAEASEFGDATAADVTSGKTFTSKDGLKITGNGSAQSNSYNNGYTDGKNSVQQTLLTGAKTELPTSGTFSGYSFYVATAITYNRNQYSVSSMQASLNCSAQNASMVLVGDTGSSQEDKSAWCRTWVVIPSSPSNEVYVSVSGKKAALVGIK